MADDKLAGIGVLVTRPAHQAAALATAIEAAGGRAFLFPAIEIVPRPTRAIADDAARLRRPDITIFVSANAVRYGLDYAGAARIGAIGPATAAAIEAAGRPVDIQPNGGFDSEHLLAEPELNDVAGKTIRIVRGQSGRELLARSLLARGAAVEYLGVYMRRAPQPDPATLARLGAAWQSGDINVVTVMSVETLLNLLSVLPDECRNRFRETPLVTPAERVIIEATTRFQGIPTVLAEGTSPNDIVRAIARHAHGNSA